ncbi:MAG TPA: M23 family metallopeptidase [Anaerolineaceae bacterium]|nr:M23 family metallopeptidase [Anaerolineaceae bacterium]
MLWENLVRMGLGEAALRVGSGLASIALILLVVWVMGNFYLKGEVNSPQTSAIAAAPTSTPQVALPAISTELQKGEMFGITRLAQLRTLLPSRPRFEIGKYTVQQGDTVIGIAEKYGLQPQSILWGNYDVLFDDPHRLFPGDELRILPVDGLVYEWNAGDGLNGVAEFFGVTPEAIVDWPSNKLNKEALGDYAAPNIAAGTLLFIPGGEREWRGWSNTFIPRSNPGVAKLAGPGFCGEIYTGNVGIGAFVWPTTARFISGYNYSPGTNHRAIDIGGAMGNALYAADSGVVVYSGWNNFGYGNVVVIDHGNGWQTLYAHIMDGGLLVGCGQSVSQGEMIANMGSTGNSSGPHLHFEMIHESYGKVNPLDYVTP